MNISTVIGWQPVNWPSTTPSTEYAVFLDAATSPSQTVTGSAIEASVTFDDASGHVFVIRPTDGMGGYGPAQAVVVGNLPQNNRAWMRDYVRKAIGDRTDAVGLTTTPKVSDDELNAYINDAVRLYRDYFPAQNQTNPPLAGVYQQRTYTLPADFVRPLEVLYTGNGGQLQFYLVDEPYKAGESTVNSFVGFPKLGWWTTLSRGRLFAGHFQIQPGVNPGDLATLLVDFDPRDGDTFTVTYVRQPTFPTSDLSTLDIRIEDLEMLSLYVQAKAWTQIEANDVSLSRWRTKADGGRRDDLPTEKMSTRMYNAWDVWVKSRRALRPKARRIVRRA
jgi:hypothetical protein